MFASIGLLVIVLKSIQAQPVLPRCSDKNAEYRGPRADDSKCEGFRRGNSYNYPADFKYKNVFTWYTCPTSGLRIVTSSGLPNHNVKGTPFDACVTPWQVELPLKPTVVSELHEPGPANLIGMQLNGVPMFGPQELEGQNAVLGLGVPDAQWWYGHATPRSVWHYHSPLAGFEETPTEKVHLGYAMDGFPLYGVLKDPSVLDSCNGRMVNDQYQYHIRTKDQVNGTGPMCNGTSPAILWNYIFGCFHGDISKTKVGSSETSPIPSDCVKDEWLNAKGLNHTYNTHQYGHRRF